MRHPLAVTPELAAKYGVIPRTDLPTLTTHRTAKNPDPKTGGNQQRDSRQLKSIIIESMQAMGEFDCFKLTEYCCCKLGTVQSRIQDCLEEKTVKKIGMKNKRAVYKWVGKP